MKKFIKDERGYIVGISLIFPIIIMCIIAIIAMIISIVGVEIVEKFI